MRHAMMAQIRIDESSKKEVWSEYAKWKQGGSQDRQRVSSGRRLDEPYGHSSELSILLLHAGPGSFVYHSCLNPYNNLFPSFYFKWVPISWD